MKPIYDKHGDAFKGQCLTREYYTDNKPVQYLKDDSPSRTYVTGNIYKTSQHEGQLKLLLRIMQFMTYVVNIEGIDARFTMLYAGMASGGNMILISKLFPMMRIHGIDPAKFHMTLVKKSRKQGSKIKLSNKFFTDQTAKHMKTVYDKYRKRGIIFLFVSDIRLSPSEPSIKLDMENQKKWVEIMKPDYSLLKFRPSWQKGKLEYPPGTIQLQHFPPQGSTETGLIIHRKDINKVRLYDNIKYQNQLFYFNTITRLQSYKKWSNKYAKEVLDEIPGLDTCNDCSGLIYSCIQYMNLFPEMYNGNLIKFVQDCLKYTVMIKGSTLESSYIRKQFSHICDRMDQYTRPIHIAVKSYEKAEGIYKTKLKSQIKESSKPIIQKLKSLLKDLSTIEHNMKR